MRQFRQILLQSSHHPWRVPDQGEIVLVPDRLTKGAQGMNLQTNLQAKRAQRKPVTRIPQLLGPLVARYSTPGVTRLGAGVAQIVVQLGLTGVGL